MKEYNFTEDASSLILPQFRDSPRVHGLVESLVQELQPLSDGILEIQKAYGLLDIQSTYDPESTEQHQLDMLGKLLNVSRMNRSNEDYLHAITVQITINQATGTTKNFMELLNLLIPDVPYNVIEQYPASVTVMLYRPQDIVDEDTIKDIAPIGVGVLFMQNPYADKRIWDLAEYQLDNMGQPEYVVGTGLNSVLPDVADMDTSDLTIIDFAFMG